MTAVAVVIFTLLALDSQPIRIYVYVLFPLTFWKNVFNDWGIALYMMDNLLHNRTVQAGLVVIIGIVEILVIAATNRSMLALIFVVLGLWPYVSKTTFTGDVSKLSFWFLRTKFPLFSSSHPS
jgi:hypothetical protein